MFLWIFVNYFCPTCNSFLLPHCLSSSSYLCFISYFGSQVFQKVFIKSLKTGPTVFFTMCFYSFQYLLLLWQKKKSIILCSNYLYTIHSPSLPSQNTQKTVDNKYLVNPASQVPEREYIFNKYLLINWPWAKNFPATKTIQSNFGDNKAHIGASVTFE